MRPSFRPPPGAARYAKEKDFAKWQGQLEIVGPLELSHLKQVEAFCEALTSRHKRIHALINNAAQTLTRAATWHNRMDDLEASAAAALPPSAHALLRLPPPPAGAAPPTLRAAPKGGAKALAVPRSAGSAGAGGAGGGGADRKRKRVRGDHTIAEAAAAAFPVGRLDESMQPLDLSATNSWSRRIGQVRSLAQRGPLFPTTVPRLPGLPAADAAAPGRNAARLSRVGLPLMMLWCILQRLCRPRVLGRSRV